MRGPLAELFLREARLARRIGGGGAMGVVFFLILVTITPFAIGPDLNLLSRIGPAILVTHSKAGPFGWLIADARPKLVRGIVAVEPGGPPFEDTVLRRGPSRAWGVSDIPMTYDPPAASPEELKRERDAAAEGPDLAVCMRQAAPARRLPNLVGIPIAILTGEASYHAVYDHCTANYLAQAGVANEHIRLERKGIRGNGHGMPNERNNLEMAALVAGWLKSKGL